MRMTVLRVLAILALASPAAAVDVVSVTDFRAEPSQPTAGQPVSFTLTVKGAARAPLDVPWQVQVGSQLVGSGTLSVPAGGTSSATARWTATAGSHVAVGKVSSPQPEDPVAAANNERRLPLSVSPAPLNAPRELPVGMPAPAPGGAAPRPPERRFLDMASVRAAGAGFSTRLDATPPGARPCATTQNDTAVPGPKNVMTTLDCRGLALPHGQKADVELYRGLRLRNGWTVRSATVQSDRPPSPAAGFRSTRLPAAGSTDVTTQLHLWAEANQFVWTYVIVEVEGPAGTQPF